MLSQPKNRVQAIKSKFENLNSDAPKSQLYKIQNDSERRKNKENSCQIPNNSESDASSDEIAPNRSYLHKVEVKRSSSDTKPSLSRQISDPGKKLHRSHAFRCDRTQLSPKRNIYATRSVNMDKRLSKDRLKKLGDFLEVHMKRENFVPPDLISEVREISPVNSMPDSQVPPHILAQYAQVIKSKRKESDAMTDSGVSSETENLDDDRSRVRKLTSQFEHEQTKPDKLSEKPIVPEKLHNSLKPFPKPDRTLTDETDMPEKSVDSLNKTYGSDRPQSTLDISRKIELNTDATEKQNQCLELEPQVNDKISNLSSMEELAGSSETMKLERKNPHLILTDTLKKALKQPLPPGPPPKKPPRVLPTEIDKESHQNDIEKEKLDTKRKLEKLEQLLKKKEADTLRKNNIYDIAEENLSLKRPKEVHYLCTEILDITQRTLLLNDNANNNSPLKNCFGRLNCAKTASISSLPYNRLSSNIDSNRNSCLCNDDTTSLLNNCQKTSSDENILNEFKISNQKCYICQKTSETGQVDCKNCQTDKKNAEKCKNCQINEEKGFKCHLECDCKIKSSEFYVDTHIYDEPFECNKNMYGTLNPVKINSAFSKSLEDLTKKQRNESIYEIPCDIKPPSPQKTDFQKLLENFESGAMKANSTENLDAKFVKRSDRSSDARAKYATEVKRYRRDVDREEERISITIQLNRLMDEMAEVRASNMEDNKPASFPTDLSDSTSEESVKLNRCLTEKRKNYVRRVSSRLAYLDPTHLKNTKNRSRTQPITYDADENPYTTFRSWKSFRASKGSKHSKMEHGLTDDVDSSNVESVDSDVDSLDGKTGCVDIELPFVRENGLFNVCLLVGLNYMTGEAYVKSVFPSQVKVPQHIENLIFPETFSQERDDWTTEANATQCYNFVLTDEKGERSYGYCRRVLPEGATTCLPLCYCIIGRYRAPGFYYKVLREIESHHGSSDMETNIVLQKLFEADFPNPGEAITIEYENETNLPQDLATLPQDSADLPRDMANLPQKRVSPPNSPSDDSKCKTMPELRNIDLEKYGDNNNSDNVKVKTIPRPIDPRLEDDCVYSMAECCGAGVLVKMFATLLHERKLILRANTLSVLSSCMSGVQSIVYPFVWQQPLISCAPAALHKDVAHAPLPILAGLLASNDVNLQLPIEEGMFIDLTHPSKILSYQGDETTILPTYSYKTLKTTLQMELLKNNRDDVRTKNLMIAEAFLRFFVDILGDFWRFFRLGEKREGDMGKGDVVFDRDSFIKSATSKQNQYFLEWFTETAMFNHFIQNMSVKYYYNVLKNPPNDNFKLIDTPSPDFYQLFEEKLQAKTNRGSDKSGYKNALNKAKLLKARLKELVG